MRRNNRIVNIRYTVDGLHFDAAIDCDWQLHNYKFNLYDYNEGDETVTPIELYCINYPDWDIKMIYYKTEEGGRVNTNQYNPRGYNPDYIPLVHTVCDMDFIIEETRKWINENK